MLDVRDAIVKHLVPTALLVGERRDELVHAGDADIALRGDERGEERDEVCHGLVHGAPEDAGVQVARGPGDGEFVVGDPAQAVGEAGRACVEPVVV